MRAISWLHLERPGCAHQQHSNHGLLQTETPLNAYMLTTYLYVYSSTRSHRRFPQGSLSDKALQLETYT